MLAALAAEVLQEISRSTGQAYGPIAPTDAGESGSTFVVHAGAERLILKLEPAWRAEAHRRAAKASAFLAARGYPAPSIIATGVLSDHAYTLRSRLPGAQLRPEDGRYVQPLIALVEQQAGAAAALDLPDDQWPSSVVDPVFIGGAGYCLLETLRCHSPESAALLDALQTLVTRHRDSLPAARDIVHYDFNPANILVASGRVTGVVDWEGVRAGDRAFDLATLLFYVYDADGARPALWTRLLELRSPAVAAVYLAHVMLRQVEWSLRLHAPQVGRRYIDRAHRVLGDLAALAA
jgi:Ser/Thr protein kinase RdoA (MazF antagonist)